MSDVKLVLAFDNGDPALVESVVGRGRVFLLPVRRHPVVAEESQRMSRGRNGRRGPAFPPVIQEMLARPFSPPTVARCTARRRTAGRNHRETSGDASIRLHFPTAVRNVFDWNGTRRPNIGRSPEPTGAESIRLSRKFTG
jgi:hypothetical protein